VKKQGFYWLGQGLPLLAGLIVPVAVAVIWFVATYYVWLPEQLLPPPQLVYQSFVELWQEGELQFHVQVSLTRLGASVFLGASIGVVLGVAMAISVRIKQLLFPSFNLLAQFPVIGWVPILVIILGIDEPLKIWAIAVAVLPPVTINVYRGIRQIPRLLLEAADVLQFSILDVFKKLIIPATLPNFFSGLRQGLMQGWLTLVFVELLASSEGIGYLMVWGRQLMQMDLIVVAMIVIGIIGFTIDVSLGFIERRLQPWQLPQRTRAPVKQKVSAVTVTRPVTNNLPVNAFD
jgi:sulfonate transport system permease protein